MLNKLEEIREKFRADMRMFELYHQDIQKSIQRLQEDNEKLLSYLKNDGSIAKETTSIQNSDGTVSFRPGIEDTPEVRKVVEFATQNKLDQMKGYIEISLSMAFSHLLAIFDAKHMDVLTVYYKSISHASPEVVNIEKKVKNIGHSGFKSQLESYKNDLQIDFKQILGNLLIDQIFEMRETRNLIVHNTGIVNGIYLAKVVNSPFSAGEKRMVTLEYFEQATDAVETFFHEFANQISLKMRSAILN